MASITGAVKAIGKALRLREGHARNDAAWRQRSSALLDRMNSSHIHPTRATDGRYLKVSEAKAQLDHLELQVAAIEELDEYTFGPKIHRMDEHWHSKYPERSKIYWDWKWNDSYVEDWRTVALQNRARG